MKKLSLIISFVLISLSAFMQTEIVINFGILQNGSQLVLDSIIIENQTVGCDTTIYNTQADFSFDMISGINSISTDPSNKLSVKQNYPNPFSGETLIEAFIPGNKADVRIYDISGKLLLSQSFITSKGLHSFLLTSGDSQQYIASFSSMGQEQSIKLTNSGKSDTKLSIKQISTSSESIVKTFKDAYFTYNQYDVLSFTGYVTVCNLPESTSFTDSPISSQTYNFDFTYIEVIQPETPENLTATVGETSVEWSWTSVSDAIGYKYNFSDDYSSATDNSTATTFLQESLIAGTNYELYVWAYNECGQSFPLELHKATQALPLTQDEIDLILSGASNTAFELMYICEQPDSMILRALSTNVIIGEANLQQLTDRMKVSVLAEGGVGIAAPQIGINRRVIWVKRYDIGAVVHPWEVYFNPRIVEYSDTIALRSDGCLSVEECLDEYDITGNSWRAKWIAVEYYLADGTYVFERINQAYTAHIFQHEIDHLDGIMYFDRQVEINPDKYIIIEGESYGDKPKID